MSAILTPAATYALQGRIANDRLRNQTEKADKLLDEKEKLSKLLDMMGDRKGFWPSKQDLAALRDAAGPLNGMDSNTFAESKFTWNGKDGNFAHQDWKDNKECEANARAWDEMMKTVQRAMDRVSTKLEKINSGLEITKAELEDAVSRENKAYTKADAIMKELRNG